MPLRTDYTNDVLDTSKNRERKYSMTENADGTVSLRDVTVYTQEGTVFGAGDINATNSAVNNANDNIDYLRNNVNIINDNLTSKGVNFRFSINGEGKYGYLGADDSFIPFKKGGEVIASEFFSPVGLVDRTYVMPDDGKLWVSANNVNTISTIHIYLNGVDVSDYSTSTSGEGNYGSLKQLKGRTVKKGDTVRIVSDNRGSGSHRCNYFILLIGE